MSICSECQWHLTGTIGCLKSDFGYRQQEIEKIREALESRKCEDFKHIENIK